MSPSSSNNKNNNDDNKPTTSCATPTSPTTIPRKTKRRAAVSFTGGKDCHLALERARDACDVYELVCLVVFHPPHKVFRAHPLAWQQAQAKALQLPLAMYCVDATKFNGNYQQAYAAAIQALVEDYQIDTLITGDIDYVGTMTTNFMTQVCETLVPQVSVWLPLWQANRRELLQEMIVERHFQIIFSCVKTPLTPSWIGKALDQEAMAELQQFDIDLTGENGEYHTMIVASPSYEYGLRLLHEKGQDLFVELTNEPGQKENEQWFVCHPSIKLVPDDSGS